MQKIGITTPTVTQHSGIRKVVEEGLAKRPKQLPSWLFYDEVGDKIFQEIMRMPEYYLTASEYEILEMNKEKLWKFFSRNGDPFELVELGAGDGLKTEVLLQYFQDKATSFTYLPVDVSDSVLSQLVVRLGKSVPNVNVKPINKRYHEAVIQLHEEDPFRKVFLFLGANVGNFTVQDAALFVKKIAVGMHPDDQLLIGFDLKKNPRLIQAAYDDPGGITRRFNLNLLVRLNRELGADFQLDKFSHYPFYNPETGTTKSYLVSLADQQVHIKALNKTVHFNRWELIHTEISQKYDIEMIRVLAEEAGLSIEYHFFDRKEYFCDVLFRKDE